MRKILFLVILCSFFLAKSQSENGLLNETNKYAFYGHYWINLHHFLYNEALVNVSTDSTLIPTEVKDKLGEYEKKRLNNVIQFYKDSVIGKDLPTDPYLNEFEKWLIQESQLSLTGIPSKFRVISFQLVQVSLIYRTYFWEEHLENITNTLNENLINIQTTENEMFDRLSNAFKREWKDGKIRVDICYLGNLSPLNSMEKTYITKDPFRIIIGSQPIYQPQGNWVETLYLNSLMNVKELNKSQVNEYLLEQTQDLELSYSILWVEFQYFITGYITKQLLETAGIENYETFLTRNEIEAGHNKVLNKYIPKYLKNKKSYEWCIEKVVKKLSK